MAADEPMTEELLRRARAGDGTALQQLLERHRERLRRMIAVRMDPRLAARVDPSDVIQEAMAEAYRELPGYIEEPPCAFYPWLRQIAWKHLVELHRHHILAGRRTVTREVRQTMALSDASTRLLANQLAASQTSVSARMAREELFSRVQQALEQLSPQDREVVVLRHMEQLSLKEVGEVLAISHTAARSRYRRAVERLHGMLGGGSEDLR